MLLDFAVIRLITLYQCLCHRHFQMKNPSLPQESSATVLDMSQAKMPLLFAVGRGREDSPVGLNRDCPLEPSGQVLRHAALRSHPRGSDGAGLEESEHQDL